MTSVSFSYNNVTFRLRQARNVKRWLLDLVAQHKAEAGTIGVVFCGDEFLLAMNREYLSHDYYTDIITFDYSEGKWLNGELYVSIDRVRENAKTLGVSPAEELHRVLAHGLLHLIGFSDKTPSAQARMRKEEDRALSLRQF